MSSLIKNVKFTTDYGQLAQDIMKPVTNGQILDEKEYFKRNDINQGVSQGLAKKSFDEEIMYHLRKKTEDNPFNMIEVQFEKSNF